MNSKLKVMMATEGTYPFHLGGVSSWCDMLVNNLSKNIEFTVFSIMMNPFVEEKFTLPYNAKLIKVPLWGTEEPSEHLEIPFSQVYIAKKYTVDKIVSEKFIPLFDVFIEEIISLDKSPERLANVILEMYRFFTEYEYKKSFKSKLVWDHYKKMILDYAKDKNNNMAQPDIYSLIQSLGWLYRFFNIINTPMPAVHVCHSAAAAFCGVPCVLLKLLNKTPYLLTEHGIYLREQYLALSKRNYSSFLNTFLTRMILSIVTLSYHFADQVSPVCSYNTRWEKKFGVDSKRLTVIYNGVDKNVFTPSGNAKKNKVPTVVSIARIDPVKDIKTLIKSAAVVKQQLPDVKFIVYGSVAVPEYFEECKKLKDDLKLDDTFIFGGHLKNVAAGYSAGDVIVLTSITEGFPYSVIEAMMSGKPVVATDVGGIKEALGGGGIVVQPQNREQIASGILKLLKNPSLRFELGQEARERALNYFTTGSFLSMYLRSYLKLALAQKTGERPKSITRLKEQKILLEDGMVLLNRGHAAEAISKLRMAADQYPTSLSVPVILTQIAYAYNILGEYDRSFNELEKANIMNSLLGQRSTG